MSLCLTWKCKRLPKDLHQKYFLFYIVAWCLNQQTFNSDNNSNLMKCKILEILLILKYTILRKFSILYLIRINTATIWNIFVVFSFIVRHNLYCNSSLTTQRNIFQSGQQNKAFITFVWCSIALRDFIGCFIISYCFP